MNSSFGNCHVNNNNNWLKNQGTVSGGKSQQIEPMTRREQPKGKYFFAVSRVNGLVIDISDSCTRAGTPVVTKARKVSQNDNQLWYEDLLTGTIRSKLNDTLCLELSGK